MSQNRSSAVMQQRTNAPDSLDYYPTPPWATRAVCEFLGSRLPIDHLHVWEPACGEGHMARPLAEYFASVRASDVHAYGDHELFDFTGADEAATDIVFTNPPFFLAEEFIKAAFWAARAGVVMIVRQAFTEGTERYSQLFASRPPSYELQFTERVVMLKNRLIQANRPDPFNRDASGKPRKASTASSYVALIWLPGDSDTKKRWIAPCRARLERPGDYPVYEVAP